MKDEEQLSAIQEILLVKADEVWLAWLQSITGGWTILCAGLPENIREQFAWYAVQTMNIGWMITFKAVMLKCESPAEQLFFAKLVATLAAESPHALKLGSGVGVRIDLHELLVELELSGEAAYHAELEPQQSITINDQTFRVDFLITLLRERYVKPSEININDPGIYVRLDRPVTIRTRNVRGGGIISWLSDENQPVVYRLDNSPVRLIAVEIDGHEYHERTKEQAARDRARDRLMAQAGIQVVRFTASEVYNAKGSELTDPLEELIETAIKDLPILNRRLN